MKKKNLLKERGAGVLLAISSLPSPYGIGTLGKAAYDFVDSLKQAGQTYWQVLPIGPTSFGDSPYQSFSAFAGNPYFIDLDMLVEEKLLNVTDLAVYDWGSDPANVDYAAIYKNRYKVLEMAFERSKHESESAYRSFVRKNAFWLEDYALYMSFKNYFKGEEWEKWPKEIRNRDKEVIAKYTDVLKKSIKFWKFVQYKFFTQFFELKKYANKKGIYIIGDIPLYVSYDSSDVWSHPDQFQLDKNRRPSCVAGVPPDIFSEDGQLWGNPIYDWKAMKKNGYKWWRQRMEMSATFYDVIRIDHFIGIVNYWSIPAKAKKALYGKWVKGPGRKLTEVIKKSVGDSKIIAEDLGVITPKVRKLIDKMEWPGMKILQFAFDGNPSNEYLPPNYSGTNYIVYGGTHDNDTWKGYLDSLKEYDLKYIRKYLNLSKEATIEDYTDAMIRLGYMSVASTVIFQMQDLLCLDTKARMNFPSTIGTNWKYRMTDEKIPAEVIKKLKRNVKLYNR
ncbi:MAG: 4-alpha-glucanotransferase [Lachnospiraceae bacterium]|nr:4-alpha-glucanotransferase [Lachnospiraceae bacterium]